MKKVLSVFVDESGDTGFKVGSSKYYVVSLVFHNQKFDISSQIKKFKNDPVFHAGPIIRREAEFESYEFSERKKLLNKALILFSILPITHAEFVYRKKEFFNDDSKVLLRLEKDLASFLSSHSDFFSDYELINLYYDKGQQLVLKALIKVFGSSGYRVVFKENIKQDDYRLAQIADFITTIRLTELKIESGELSKSEKKFFENKKIFKRLYLRLLKKKKF